MIPQADLTTTNPILQGFVQHIKQSTKAFIADRVSKEIDTEGVTSGTYFTLSSDTTLGTAHTFPAGAHGVRAVGGDFAQLPPSTASKSTFNCDEFGFETRLDDTLKRRNQVNVNLEQLYARRVLMETLRARELRVQSVLQSTASITTNNQTLSGTSQWSDYTNSTPISDITDGVQNVIDATAYDAAEMELFAVTTQPVMLKLRFHPELQSQFGGGYAGNKAVSEEQLAEFFGFDEVIVAHGFKNSANVGQTVSLTQLWSDDFLIGVRPKTAMVETCIGHATFRSKDTMPEQYDVPPRNRAYLVSHEMDEVLVKESAFHLIKDCLA